MTENIEVLFHSSIRIHSSVGIIYIDPCIKDRAEEVARKFHLQECVLEEDEHYLMTKEFILNKIATLTAGRAAEELVFGQVTSGASNDIEQATKLARAMVTRLGMSENFDMTAFESVTNVYLGGDSSLACSEKTSAEIDQEIVAIIKNAHAKAVGILKENENELHKLAAYLLERETITGEEFMAILNNRGNDPQPLLPVSDHE